MALKPHYNKGMLEAGLDEAGRGCLAGPVVAAAVILPDREDEIPGINDSKQLTKERRESMVAAIQSQARSWAIGVIENTEIDRINILQASVKAMNQAVQQLTVTPDFLLVDGHYFHTQSGLPYQCIKKGDATYAAIAAASILAKVYRDQLMEAYHEDYPQYQWLTNKGYPTPPHRKAIEEHGPSPLHRQSFKLYKEGKQLGLSF